MATSVASGSDDDRVNGDTMSPQEAGGEPAQLAVPANESVVDDEDDDEDWDDEDDEDDEDEDDDWDGDDEDDFDDD